MTPFMTSHLVGVVGGLPNNSYSTLFPLTENPMLESAVWKQGLVDGLDWHNVRTTPAFAFGTQDGSTNYTDSVAALKGTWSNDQVAIATVRTVNQQTGSIFEEVEILLRYEITAHSVVGYEFTYACRPVGDAGRYIQINRWNGVLGDFTTLDGRAGPGLNDGDRIKASCIGNPKPILRIYIAPAADPNNFTEVFNYDTVSDSIVYASGKPGIGMYNQGGDLGMSSDFGLTAFSATAS